MGTDQGRQPLRTGFEPSPLQATAARRPREIATEAARLTRTLLGRETEVIWFGSWPQGRARPHSDLDLAVSIGVPIPFARMAALREAVEHIPTLFEIDLVDLASVGPSLREEITRYGVRL